MHYQFKTKPDPWQKEGLIRALKQGHIGLLWAPGVGKSKVIVDWVSCLQLQEGPVRVLIVCPFSVIGVWEDEFADHCPIPYEVHLFDKKDKQRPPRRKKLQILVAGYDLVWRRDAIIKAYDPHVVIADESHKIKKPSARRSRYLRRYNKAPHRAILTGTPNPKSFLDLYSQWVFLNPKRFGTNFAAFKENYVRFGGYRGYQVQGYRNVEELKAKVDADASVINEEVLNLKEPIHQRIPINLEPQAWDAYQKMAYELFLELTHGEVSDAANVAVKLMRLQQITGGWIKSDEGNLHRISTAKMDTCAERLENLFDADEKVVVFARFKPEVQGIYDLGARFKVPSYVLRGGVGRAERDQARRDFQAGKGRALFVAQIAAGGLGITLHSARQGIFYSVSYALDEFIQAQKRLQRRGQSRTVRYQYLTARRTVDLDIYQRLKAKKSMMDLIMTPKGRALLAQSLAKNLGLT